MQKGIIKFIEVLMRCVKVSPNACPLALVVRFIRVYLSPRRRWRIRWEPRWTLIGVNSAEAKDVVHDACLNLVTNHRQARRNSCSRQGFACRAESILEFSFGLSGFHCIL